MRGKREAPEGRETRPSAKDGKADPEQFQRFLETARELGCDEDPLAFREKLKLVAQQHRKTEPEPKPKKTTGRKPH